MTMRVRGGLKKGSQWLETEREHHPDKRGEAEMERWGFLGS